MPLSFWVINHLVENDVMTYDIIVAFLFAGTPTNF